MKRKIVAVWLALILASLLIFLWRPVNREIHKEEWRAAIDIGSGATNLKIAIIDPQTNKIIKDILEKSIPVAYQKHLEQSSDETFDPEVMNEGIIAIKTLKDLSESYGVKKVIAVATAAFRKSKNAEQFAREIEQKTGVLVRIIDQDEEGILAFRGALAVTSVAPENALTWDIGGGSMQLTTLSNEGTYLVEKGKTASIPFKNYVIREVKKQDLKEVQSPNPHSMEEMQAAINYAASLAQDTNPFIKEKIQDPKTKIFGVGSLLNKAIRPMISNSILRQEELEKKVVTLAGKKDEELPGGALAEVAVTNPLLVLGYVKGLHMDQVEIVNVNNADGALTYPVYWQ